MISSLVRVIGIEPEGEGIAYMIPKNAQTPMMRQYLKMKDEAPDALLLFRMGDFYEAFWDDARVVSEALGLVLTHRGKDSGQPIPMAGVPHHALDNYLGQLLEQGHRVAVAEQLEDPKTAKGLVKRGITRILTPGLVREPEGLDSERPNWLAAIAVGDHVYGLALLDVSTGDFRVGQFPKDGEFVDFLVRQAPAEVIFQAGKAIDENLLERVQGEGMTVAYVEGQAWSFRRTERLLCDHFGVNSLEAFGVHRLVDGLAAAGGVFEYLRIHLNDEIQHIGRVGVIDTSNHMGLDNRTAETLELFETRRERQRAGSLISVLDRSVTRMGSRLLRERIAMPLRDAAQINQRLDEVSAFVTDEHRRKGVRDILSGMYDIERLAGKLGAATATPRDLIALGNTLERLPKLNGTLRALGGQTVRGDIPELVELARQIRQTLVDEPPLSPKEGGLIQQGVHPELDRLRSLARGAKNAMAQMETVLRRDTSIGNLRIKYNRVFGYFIEVTRSHLEKVPAEWTRKQTLANAERYITPELKDFEQQVLTANERSHALEYEIFSDLRAAVQQQAGTVGLVGRRLAEVDVQACLAEVAHRHGYVRPEVDGSPRIAIEDGRHPVIEQTLPGGERFVPNSITLDSGDGALMLLTGPNMAGKSTVLRQVGLIVVMAQLGSFVPASSAQIGVVDRLFTRVGASDDLSRGQSTFMVEMTETATLLNAATERSLLLLDEIGRGTATFDGLAIAWAVAEDVHDRIGCRAMFATHYHELTDLTRTRPRCFNRHLAVAEWGERIVFLRALRDGGASRSYGIQVARLAGLPESVITRAGQILRNLETDEIDAIGQPRLARSDGSPDAEGADVDQLQLFVSDDRRIRDHLAAFDPNRLTPIEAMNILVDLRRLAGFGDEDVDLLNGGEREQ